MFIKLCNLGHDAEVRYTQTNKAVTSLALAYSIGYGEHKKTQWIEGSLWGDRAEKLAQYLTKGTKVLLIGDDLEIETYQKRDGSQGFKLKCRVVDIEFAGSKPDGSQPRPQPQQQQQWPQSYPRREPTIAERERAMAAQQPQQPQYPDFDDDIPFMRLSSSEALG